MTRSSEQIKRDLEAIENKVADIAVELRRIYLQYLDLLSQSIEKQLVLASYRICTQEYPESFLGLSFNERQTLQQNLRQLGKEIRSQLLDYLETSKEPANDSDRTTREILTQLSLLEEKNEDLLEKLLSQEPELSEQTSTETEIEKTDRESSEIDPSNTTNPEHLIRWHQQIQKGINRTLASLSKQANQLLEEANILPHQLPDKVLEMAIQAEDTDSAVRSHPNLLNLLIEAENEDKSQEAKITKITAIRLRLAEIEFSDPTLSAQGNQIRTLLAKINKVKQHYQNKQQELSVAKAETAWRSSWYED
ncbi:MAG: hypothetical protein AB4038_15885 [Prochloraceae cyanobacterium]